MRLCVDVLDAAVEALPQQSQSKEGGGGSSSSSSSSSSSISEDKGVVVTQILGVFDLRGLNPTCLDFEFISFLIETIYKYYPQRLGQVFQSSDVNSDQRAPFRQLSIDLFPSNVHDTQTGAISRAPAFCV